MDQLSILQQLKQHIQSGSDFWCNHDDSSPLDLSTRRYHDYQLSTYAWRRFPLVTQRNNRSPCRLTVTAQATIMKTRSQALLRK